MSTSVLRTMLRIESRSSRSFFSRAKISFGEAEMKTSIGAPFSICRWSAPEPVKFSVTATSACSCA